MIIVSGYYTIPSKKSKEFYYEHIKRFFRKLNWQKIIFFTDQENLDSLKLFAGPNVQFVLQEFDDLPIFQDFSQEFWKRELLFEHKKYHKCHTWQLGVLWASKSYFVRRASELVDDEWFIWVDAGCVRKDEWNLDDFTNRNTFSESGVYVQLLTQLASKEFFEFPDVFIAGSHILFHRSYIQSFIDSYNEQMNKYIKNNFSTISDQYIMASMCKNTSFLKTVSYTISCPDKWFFMFYVI
jgi:hypothetical protein